MVKKQSEFGDSPFFAACDFLFVSTRPVSNPVQQV